MSKRFLIILSIALPLFLIIFYYKFYDAGNNYSIQCGLYRFTGFLCPGCGGQRALHHLLHGEFLTALKDNAVFVVGLPFLIYLYFVCVRVYIFNDLKYSNSFVFSSKFGYSILIILLIFFILRNIPVYPFTYLLPD